MLARKNRKKERPAKKKGGNPEKERENAKCATGPLLAAGAACEVVRKR